LKVIPETRRVHLIWYLCFYQFRCNCWRPIAQKHLLIQTIISPFSLAIHILAYPNATLLPKWFIYNQQKWQISGVMAKMSASSAVIRWFEPRSGQNQILWNCYSLLLHYARSIKG